MSPAGMPAGADAGYRPLAITFAVHGSDDQTGSPPPLSILTPPHKWHYASLSSALDLGPPAGHPVLVRVTAVVRDGPIGIALISASDLSRLLAPQCILEASEAPQEARFIVDAGEPCRIVVRTAADDRAGEVRIEGVSATDAARAIREHEINAPAHWFYTVDFGDGFVRRATVSDEASWTRAKASERAVVSRLLGQFIGPIEGRRLLDVACCAGHFSLFFARMGARVHGFDRDQAAIDQARIVAKYTGEGRPGSVEFSVSDLDAFAPPLPFDIVFCSGLFYHLRDPLGGAEKLRRLTNRWLILQSCVSARDDAVFELSDPAHWPFCADWEFALVPSASMVRQVFEKTGFRVRGAWRLGDFIVEPGAEVATLKSEAERGEEIERLGDPVYMVLEKA